MGSWSCLPVVPSGNPLSLQDTTGTCSLLRIESLGLQPTLETNP